jgi:cysteine-rich repeat protein
MPVNGDGCCPPGATIGTDNDCPARCGDRVVTAPETCDDGNMTSGDGCSATCMLEMSMLSAFRFESLVLRDPHAFARVLFCIDITDQLNTQLSDAITMDTDMPADGQLNLSIAQIFNPLVRTAGSSTATYLSFPDCSAPMSSTSCTLPMGGTRAAMTTAMNLGGTSVCLAPLAGTVRPYSPAVISPTAGGGATCYIANGGSVTFTLAGIPITLTDAQIGGEWRSATQIGDGLIRGFLSEADANAAIIPASVAVVGGMPLSAVLRGGMGNCASGSDMDTGPGGVRGWYMYLNFTARLVPYTEL